jgi:AcrR family transcriptional regulator
MTAKIKTTRRAPAEAKRPSVVAAKQKRDPAGTRARILAAAISEFSTYGLGGARVDRITRRARANKRMLYYYFGRKEQLFVAVLEATYEKFGAAQQKLELEHYPPAQAMERLLAFLWSYFCDHPEFIRLLNSENLHQGRHIKKSTRIAELANPILGILDGVLRRGQQAGEFRADTDLNQLYITVTGLGYFYLANKHTLSALLSMDMLSPEARAARLAHINDVVFAYLTHK